MIIVKHPKAYETFTFSSVVSNTSSLNFLSNHHLAALMRSLRENGERLFLSEPYIHSIV